MPKQRKNAIINSIPLSELEKDCFLSDLSYIKGKKEDTIELRMFMLFSDLEDYLSFNPEHRIESGDVFHQKIRSIVEESATKYG